MKKNYRQTLETSYKLRIKGDYGKDIGEIVLLDKKIIEEQIEDLKEFLKEVKNVT